MSTLKALRFINAVATGNTPGATIETLLNSDPSQRTAFVDILNYPSQIRSFTASCVTMNCLFGSSTATCLMFQRPYSCCAILNSFNTCPLSCGCYSGSINCTAICSYVGSVCAMTNLANCPACFCSYYCANGTNNVFNTYFFNTTLSNSNTSMCVFGTNPCSLSTYYQNRCIMTCFMSSGFGSGWTPCLYTVTCSLPCALYFPSGPSTIIASQNASFNICTTICCTCCNTPYNSLTNVFFCANTTNYYTAATSTPLSLTISGSSIAPCNCCYVTPCLSLCYIPAIKNYFGILSFSCICCSMIYGVPFFVDGKSLTGCICGIFNGYGTCGGNFSLFQCGCATNFPCISYCCNLFVFYKPGFCCFTVLGGQNFSSCGTSLLVYNGTTSGTQSWLSQCNGSCIYLNYILTSSCICSALAISGSTANCAYYNPNICNYVGAGPNCVCYLIFTCNNSYYTYFNSACCNFCANCNTNWNCVYTSTILDTSNNCILGIKCTGTGLVASFACIIAGAVPSCSTNSPHCFMTCVNNLVVPTSGNVIAWPVCGCCAARSGNYGNTWNAIALPVSACWNFLCYCNGCYAAASNGGATLLISNNATTWCNYPLPKTNNWTLLYNECANAATSYCSWTVVSTDGCYIGPY